MTTAGRSGRRLDVLAVVALLVWLAVDLVGRTVFGSVPWPASVVDYTIQYDAGRLVYQTHRYPAGHPYPPPAMAFQASHSVVSFPTAAVVWLALTGLAAVACYATLARAFELHRRPGLLLALPLAHAVAAYYFQWDMRSVNCNLVMLAVLLFACAALAAGRDRAAGFWFAASVALKMFPVLVLPYLAWTGRWRALAWAAGFSLVFWVGVPLVAFGGGFADVYASWVGELTRATDPIQKHVHPILISLEKAALHTARGSEPVAKAVVYAVCGLWVAAGLFGAAVSFGNKRHSAPCVFTHVALLVAGPVAVSPYLEAYHLVPLVVPAVVLTAVALDPRRPARQRAVATVAFVFAVAIRKVPSGWDVRGLYVNVQALILCAAAVWVTRATVPAAAEAPADTARRPGLLSALRRLVSFR